MGQSKALRHRKQAVRALVFVIAAGMTAWGVYRGEVSVVLGKAVNVCLECIGLG